MMNSYDDTQPEREREDDFDSQLDEHETHATTGGAAAAGAVTGGVIGLAGGPIGAAIGAVGGAIIGAASERLMHSDDDRERARAGYVEDDLPLEDDTTLGRHTTLRDDMPLHNDGDMVTDSSPIGRQSADTPSSAHASPDGHVGSPRPGTETTRVSSSSHREPANGADQLPGTDPLRNDPLR